MSLLLTVEFPATWGLLVVLCPALADTVGDVTALLQSDAWGREVAPRLDLVSIAEGQESTAGHSKAQPWHGRAHYTRLRAFYNSQGLRVMRAFYNSQGLRVMHCCVAESRAWPKDETRPNFIQGGYAVTAAALGGSGWL
jgi:hypothetical protein